MDPITLAVVSAIAAGAITGVTKVGEQAIIDAYNTLKDLLKKKFGGDSKVMQAVKSIEEDPQSKGAPIVLQEQVVKAKADQDSELQEAAKVLLEKVKQEPGGEQIVQNAIGDYNVQVAGSGNVVNVDRPKL